MPIPEAQLETWSRQGAVTGSKNTYASVKTALEAAHAPYAAKSFAVFLQGSYGNDTNVYADSDVDVVIRLDSTFYRDISHLSEADQAAYQQAFGKGSYPFADFKRDVTAHLVNEFGPFVTPGKKAIFIPGNQTRRDADVLACAQYRRYTRFRSLADQQYHSGICFWTSDGAFLVNYPKQHSDNCTQKHQDTASWFKPLVRIVKNMRNSMVQNHFLTRGSAPSYFLEGMLWNVPNDRFGRSYAESFVRAIDWLATTDRNLLKCANGLHPLLADQSPVSWNETDFSDFLNAAGRFWNGWRS